MSRVHTLAGGRLSAVRHQLSEVADSSSRFGASHGCPEPWLAAKWQVFCLCFIRLECYWSAVARQFKGKPQKLQCQWTFRGCSRRSRRFSHGWPEFQRFRRQNWCQRWSIARSVAQNPQNVASRCDVLETCQELQCLVARRAMAP